MELTNQSGTSPTPAAGGDSLGTAASTVHDMLAQPGASGADKVQQVTSRPPRSERAPLHDAVQAAARAVGREKSDTPLPRTQKQILADTVAYVRAAPLKSVSMAVATGWLLGRITR